MKKATENPTKKNSTSQTTKQATKRDFLKVRSNLKAGPSPGIIIDGRVH